MALKKSELYSSLWSSCDELRGGMDASQYKDYIHTYKFSEAVEDEVMLDLVFEARDIEPKRQFCRDEFNRLPVWHESWGY